MEENNGKEKKDYINNYDSNSINLLYITFLLYFGINII